MYECFHTESVYYTAEKRHYFLKAARLILPSFFFLAIIKTQYNGRPVDCLFAIIHHMTKDQKHIQTMLQK